MHYNANKIPRAKLTFHAPFYDASHVFLWDIREQIKLPECAVLVN